MTWSTRELYSFSCNRLTLTSIWSNYIILNFIVKKKIKKNKNKKSFEKKLQGVPFDWGWNSWGSAQACRQWQKQLQKSYLENIPWLEKLHTHHSYDQQGLLFHEKEELPWSSLKAWNSQNLIGDHLPAVGWFQKCLSLVQWQCALKILAVSQTCTKTKLQGMLHELAQSACQFLAAPP